MLEKIVSQHVEWDISEEDREQDEAVLLNKSVLEIINKTIIEVSKKGYDISPEIIISIANYVQNGKIVNRGGYGKLRLIAPNYSNYLEKELKKMHQKDFSTMLIHDGTAMALGFGDYKKSACISLGTAFGVGFPPE